MPLGLDVTVPTPSPAKFTFRVAVCACSRSNVAVQLRPAAIVTLAVCEVPLQASLQPANVDPGPAIAVSVTLVPIS